MLPQALGDEKKEILSTVLGPNQPLLVSSDFVTQDLERCLISYSYLLAHNSMLLAVCQVKRMETKQRKWMKTPRKLRSSELRSFSWRRPLPVSSMSGAAIRLAPLT